MQREIKKDCKGQWSAFRHKWHREIFRCFISPTHDITWQTCIFLCRTFVSLMLQGTLSQFQTELHINHMMEMNSTWIYQNNISLQMQNLQSVHELKLMRKEYNDISVSGITDVKLNATQTDLRDFISTSVTIPVTFSSNPHFSKSVAFDYNF